MTNNSDKKKCFPNEFTTLIIYLCVHLILRTFVYWIFQIFSKEKHMCTAEHHWLDPHYFTTWCSSNANLIFYWLTGSFLQPNYRNMFSPLWKINTTSSKRGYRLGGNSLVGRYREVREVIKATRQRGHRLHQLIWHGDIWTGGQLQLFIWYFTAAGAWHNMSLKGGLIKSAEHK